MHLEFNSPNAELAVQMDVKSVIVRSRQASNGCLSLVCQGETPLQVIIGCLRQPCVSTALALRHVRRIYAQLHLRLWTVLSWSTFSEAKTACQHTEAREHLEREGCALIQAHEVSFLKLDLSHFRAKVCWPPPYNLKQKLTELLSVTP